MIDLKQLEEKKEQLKKALEQTANAHQQILGQLTMVKELIKELEEKKDG